MDACAGAGGGVAVSDATPRKRRRWPRVLLILGVVTAVLLCAVAVRARLHVAPPPGDPRASYLELLARAHDGRPHDRAAWAELQSLDDDNKRIAEPFREEIYLLFGEVYDTPHDIRRMPDRPEYWTDWDTDDLDPSRVESVNDILRRSIDAYRASPTPARLRELLDAGTLRPPGPDPELPIMELDTWWMTRLRRLALMEQARAIRAHELGEDAEAIEAVATIMDLGLVSERHPTAISMLMGVSMRHHALDAVHQMLRRRVPSERVLADLGAVLRRAREERRADHRFLDGERYAVLEMLRRTYAGELIGSDPPMRGDPLKTQFNLPNHRRLAGMIDTVYDASVRWAALPPYERPGSPDDPETVLSALKNDFDEIDVYVPAFNRAIISVTHDGVRLDAMILRLELHRWHARHGDFPPTLEALIDPADPDALDALPTDPLNPDADFVYRAYPDDPDLYLLYSVGADGTDDGCVFDVDHTDRFVIDLTSGRDTLLSPRITPPE